MNNYRPKTNRSTTKPKAQAVIEFALVLPILLLVLIGIMETSRLLFAWLIIENSTRFGIRYATAGTYEPVYCQGYDGGLCDSDTETDAARIPSIKDETTRIVIGYFLRNARFETVANTDDLFFNVTVCGSKEEGYDFTPPVMSEPVYANCEEISNPGVTKEYAASPGYRVYVAADYNFRFG